MRKVENTKQVFIESAVRVVARDGLDKATTKAIAADAGLNEANIYRCFESKEDLLCAAFHMEDVNFAYFLKQNLYVMHVQNTTWKDRAFQLWSVSWRFILERRDDCLFYLQYYYSANCRKYAYEEHLSFFRSYLQRWNRRSSRKRMSAWCFIRFLTPCCLLLQECLAARCRMMT